MSVLPNIIFAVLLVFAVGFFIRNIQKLRRNINLGRDSHRNDRPSDR